MISLSLRRTVLVF